MKVGSASRLEPSTEIGMRAPSIKASIASSAIIPKVHSQQHINSKLVLFYTCPLLNVVFLNPWKMNFVVSKIGSKYGPKWRSSLLLDQLDQLAAMKPSEVDMSSLKRKRSLLETHYCLESDDTVAKARNLNPKGPLSKLL